MKLLGNDSWEDILDINDKYKKRSYKRSFSQKQPDPPSAGNMDKAKLSGLTIFYRVLGVFVLVFTMLKAWLWSATLFDWGLVVVSLLMIGMHRRLGTTYMIERIKPAFMDLHNRLAAVEEQLQGKQTGRSDDE